MATPITAETLQKVVWECYRIPIGRELLRYGIDIEAEMENNARQAELDRMHGPRFGPGWAELSVILRRRRLLHGGRCKAFIPAPERREKRNGR